MLFPTNNSALLLRNGRNKGYANQLEQFSVSLLLALLFLVLSFNDGCQVRENRRWGKKEEWNGVVFPAAGYSLARKVYGIRFILLNGSCVLPSTWCIRKVADSYNFYCYSVFVVTSVLFNGTHGGGRR